MPLKKKKKKKSITKRLLISVVAVIMVFVLLFIAANTFAGIPLSNASDAFTALPLRGGSFPYKAESSSVVRIASMGNGIAVLKSDSLEILDKSGDVLQSIKHNYSKPSLEIRNGRAVLFDRGGTRYMMLSKTKVLVEEKQTKEVILDASVSSTGRYAVAVSASDPKSILSVYGVSSDEIFRFKCVSEYITDIDFSSSGKQLAVTVTGVEGATPYSKVLCFDVKKDEPLSETEISDEMLFSVVRSGSSVTVTGSLGIRSYKNGTEIMTEKAFGGDVLQNFCKAENGRSSMILQTYGNERAVKLLITNKKGEIKSEVDFNEEIKAVSRSNSHTCLLTDSSVLTYNNSGTLVNTVELKEAVRDICISGRTLYLQYRDRIERCSAL